LVLIIFIPIAVVIKVRNSKEIIGGYNPLEWRSIDTDNERRHLLHSNNSLYKTSNSFIFLLTNRAIPIFSRVSSENEAIICSRSKRPSFDLKDLCIGHVSSQASRNNIVDTSSQHSYEKKIINSETFEIEEYEVFHIIDKRHELLFIMLKAIFLILLLLGIYFRQFYLKENTFVLYITVLNDRYGNQIILNSSYCFIS